MNRIIGRDRDRESSFTDEVGAMIVDGFYEFVKTCFEIASNFEIQG